MTPLSSMPAALKSISVRAVLAALVATGALTTQAGAVSLRVKLACANDYYAHCSQHAAGSPAARQCMRALGSQLSKGCVDALVSAGEVSKAEVENRRAAKAGIARTASSTSSGRD